MNTISLPLRRSTAERSATEAALPAQSRPTVAERARRVFTGPDTDPRWARPSLLALLAITVAAYTYNLTSSGWANSFYSAAVQAGSESWKAFFYGSSDASNAITVDKPPASLWIMALSVRLLGLSSFSILFPQVLMGAATVGTIYAAVKRYFGAAAGLIAGTVMALTPVAALMFRFNNPDALLVLLMTIGAYCTLRAAEHGRARWLYLAGVLIGFGFLTKMMQAFLVLPAFALVYLIAAPVSLKKRILHGLGAVASVILAAGWWIAIVSLVPASMRPYIGGSQNNSILELTLGYNGLGRLSGNETGSVGGGGGWGTTGLFRMFSSDIGGQISWFIPAALLFFGVGLFLAGRSDRFNLRRASYLIWGGWLLVTGLCFSFMAGIFHQYYTVALAPAIAALVGMGAKEAWDRRESALGSVVLATATAMTATWAFILLSRTTAYPNAFRVSILAIGLAASFLFLVVNRLHTKAVPVVAAVAILAGLAGPTAYTVSTLNTAHTGSIVTAGPSSGGMGGGMGGPGGGGAPPQTGTQNGTAAGGTTTGGTTSRGNAGGMGGLLNASTPSAEVIAALQQDAGDYTWVAAAVGSQNAAGLQLATELPVMSIGGFNGSDPSPTLAQFQQYVNQGQIHYLLASSGMGGSQNGGSNTSSQILSWAAANYNTVTIGSSTFYDLTSPLNG